MKMKTVIIAACLISLLAGCNPSAQSAGEADAAYYIEKADEHFKKSRREAVFMDPEKPGNYAMRFTKRELPEPDHYLHPITEYDAEEFKKAHDILNEGIAKYPDYLDMHLGLISMCYMNEKADCFANAIEQTLERSEKNNNKWAFGVKKGPTPTKEFMLDEIQNFQFQLFKQERDDMIKSAAEKVLQYYPDDVPSLSTLASIYALDEAEYKKAEDLLLKAEKLAPEDAIVLSNLSQVYGYMQNPEKERFYREKALQAKHGRQKGV